MLNEHDGKHIFNNKLAMEVEKAYEGRGAEEKYDYQRRMDQA